MTLRFDHGRAKLQLRITISGALPTRGYASEAMPCDPASRLAISIKRCNSSGNEVDEWIQSSGSKAAMRINTQVDMLEGIILTETRSLCRHWDVRSTEKGAPRKTNYTNE
ncbi:hypothetical protein N7471_001984 [Penicillium samsonianum]|uniref:uncharacterized protein n=1 Tax=Penicillium samsonianum TaxID=1882272 RepID=UPI0025491246|nr:uncharacterized protein N7471_001984 [Penicillium samsonianum]KAJ6142531.1 hypothetical protein N7471_001984 [Penicillium samsonianum]